VPANHRAPARSPSATPVCVVSDARPERAHGPKPKAQSPMP
jgi:hypothetical protein